jgi:hypothetical protein
VSSLVQPRGFVNSDTFRRRAGLGVIEEDSSKVKNKSNKSAAFSCEERRPGHYGDAKFDCTVYHVCDNRGGKRSFTCPEGTRFDQVT